jgi:hypothetical protein
LYALKILVQKTPFTVQHSLTAACHPIGSSTYY